ncbi:molecular chaperone [Amycolatopsis mediterranei S699]|uniref:Molecular chaperone n=1 Tax=Amycolatopsis mediterranei (strain U-32) TaxID=749927 RepID=A0A0H3CWV8_AMYMU|nr:type VII secretion-associated protein [Amycolatopsis mediterranei]ADJ42540.1 molecular chaperone [Amycolatopsis mediterranei U32]AFO74254.1 molecular chaperone [Amycolatopsis mediterranei S699]AGT81383.1 molecular chaperone [Amycolatopsis mediterranei RB]KDO09553.1 molecular chaperone [Amycolatopsis mediterranei]KDU86572.1 molecular chaperone [Amycolatopsis mediterranei]
MTVRVAVDFGTSSTCVVASVNGREPQVVVIDGQPLMSSAVYAAADGTLFVGQEAERQAAVDPSRYEPNPKRRIDEGELLLGENVLRVTDVVHAVLGRAVSEARRLAGDAEVDLLVLTHPADWGAIRTRLLRQAAGGLAREVALVPEPVAAAVYHAATFAPQDVKDDRTVEFSGRPGEALAVLDLGGGTVDVSVVRRLPPDPARDRAGRPQRGGFQVLATRGDPAFGGADIDQALLEHLGSLVSAADPAAWRELVEGRELADRRRRRVLRQDVRGAKETLSRHAYTDVPMPPPFADAHVTREDLERLIAAPLGRTVELTVAAIGDAGLRPKQLTAIFLVGGSSRIPMISRLVHERTGVVPTSLDQPETVVARGALRAVLVDPDRTGALPGEAMARLGAAPGGALNPAAQRTEVVRPGDVAPRPAPPRSGPGGFPNRPAPPPSPPSGQPVARPWPPPAGPPARPNPPGPPAGARPAPEPAGKSRRKLWGLIAAAVVVVAALVVAGVLVFENSGNQAESGRTLSQYDFKFVAPEDWVQTDDRVADKQVVIHPQESRDGNDLLVAQEYVMDYDATADPQRLVDALKRRADEKPALYSAFNPSLSYAGKTVIGYHESKQDRPDLQVDWYVVAKGRIRVHVGCQYATSALRDRVAAACAQAVRTVEILN